MMDKSCHYSSDSTNNSNNSSSNSRDQQHLRHLHRISHKISKPTIRRPPFEHQQQQQVQQDLLLQQQQQQQQQHQPPVYNINKSDFRDVVQKLTGSPAHDRFSTPPPVHPTKPQTSRLQRIRPPPLAQVSSRPSLPLNNALLPPPSNTSTTTSASVNPTHSINDFVVNSSNNGRSVSPLSPLPPLPAVHAAVESPISAYMRYLQGSISTGDSDSKRVSGLSPLAPLLSPWWNSPSLLQQQQQQQVLLPSPKSAMAPPQFLMPSSPLAFGRLPSPQSSFPLLSPSLLFPPSGGQFGIPQFPLSPRLPVPSPRWPDL